MKSIRKVWKEYVIDKFWEEFIIDKLLDRRVSVTKVAKAEELVISNASLEDLKKGMNRVYEQVYGAEKKREEAKQAIEQSQNKKSGE